MFQNQGMSTYYDQEKDRSMWKQSIENRNLMIKQLKDRGIRFPKDPQQMKLRELERMLNRE